MISVGNVTIGLGHPLVLISGLNVLESEAGAIECASSLKVLAARYGLPLIFKASFDKANRSRHGAPRGVGLPEGRRILAAVKGSSGLPILTDVHEPTQAESVASVADMLQIPAFLCRQTDLIRACAETKKPMNIKKGQFMSPADMIHAVDKAMAFGAVGVLVTERGTTFGYNDLVVDVRGLAQMRRRGPVCMDATHAAQHPGAGAAGSGGNRDFVAPLARAAVAAGVDAIFVEVHPDPPNAPCDGACQLTPASLDQLLAQVSAIQAVKTGDQRHTFSS